MLRVERRSAGLASITLDSPGDRNALDTDLLIALAAAARELEHDGSVQTIVLTATGTTFCAGANLKQPPGADFPDAMRSALVALRSVRTPVVCRLAGHVRAGGIGLVAASDVVIAADDVTLAFSEVRFALVPSLVAVVARRVMTPRAVEELVLSGRIFGAQEAQRNGLVTRAVPRAELDTAVEQVAVEFRQSNASAVGRAKTLLSDLARLDERSGLDLVRSSSVEQFTSADARAAIAHFTNDSAPERPGER